MLKTSIENERGFSKLRRAYSQLGPPYLRGFIQAALGQQKIHVCLGELIIGRPRLQPIPGLARVREIATFEQVSKIGLCNPWPLGYPTVCYDLAVSELHRVEGIEDGLLPIRRAKDSS